MSKALLKVIVFIVLLMGSFVYIGYAVTKISGGAVKVAEGVGPEAGEAIFWGKGKCHTCHSVGERGSAIRGPNQGDTGPLNLPIGLRAEERAKERTAKTGEPYTAVDYLVESLFNPSAYVVEGYKDEMPTVWKPPINLKPDEVKAVVAYLQSVGGEVDIDLIGRSRFFKKIEAASATAQAEEAFEPYLPGVPEKGKELFFDLKSNAGCAKCHTVGDRGGKVGPELTTVAGTRSLKYIIESILEPSAVIASGFEPYLIITKDGEFITGIKKKEDDKNVEIMTDEGEMRTIPKKEIETIEEQKVSIMPANFKELLTVDEFHNILAFLRTLTGEEALPEKDKEIKAKERG